MKKSRVGPRGEKSFLSSEAKPQVVGMDGLCLGRESKDFSNALRSLKSTENGRQPHAKPSGH